MNLALYRLATVLGAPLVGLWLNRRRAAGKEEATRQGERTGRPDRARPQGELIWLHAASVGESVSALPLIERMLSTRPGAHALVTTVTLTSARIMAERLPERAFHQYAPVDTPGAVRRFLDHGAPDRAIWIESELWPNMIAMSRARGIPLALVNARLSSRSHRRWRRAPRLISDVLSAFDLVLAQSADAVSRLHDLGARNAEALGNLKHDAPPLAADPGELAKLTAAVGSRRLWLAASTHEGEEAAAAAAHHQLCARYPDLLTVIAPRHPPRGAAIAGALRAAGFRLAQRSADEDITADTEIYLADTLGELGLLYRLSPIVFVGGSLSPHGGQNPLEPARLGCAVLHGPHMENFAETAAQLHEGNGAIALPRTEALDDALSHLFDDDAARAALADKADQVAAELGGALDRVWQRLEPFLSNASARSVEGAHART